jgi:tetratricopeptide (TPR) repeat protein
MAANAPSSTSSRPEDIWGAVAAFAIATLVFYRHMAPEVTLDGAGIFVTGAYQFGVPHPTGHPLWVLFGYLWSHVLVPFGNPAWRIGTMSVFTGGLLVGMLAFLTIRSTRILLHALPAAPTDDESLRRWLATTVGIATALLFGFSRGVWYWACIPEQWIQNTFAFILPACTFFLWVARPERKRFLYATLFLFAAGAADHQTVFVLAGALLAGLFAAGVDCFRCTRLQTWTAGQSGGFCLFISSFSDFWEVLVAGLVCTAAGFMMFAWLRAPCAARLFMAETTRVDAWIAIGFLAASVVLLAVTRTVGRASIARALFHIGSLLAGFSSLLLLPLAASTNPPINWGYTATKEGFLHLITRGQYGKIQPANPLDPEFLLQTKMFLLRLGHEYGWALCAFCVVAACAAVWMLFRKQRGSRRTAATWLVFLWAAFFATSLGLLVLLNPKLDRQEQEITFSFFVPAHGFCAMLIGYGMALTGWLVFRLWKAIPPWLAKSCCVALLALPLVTYCSNRTACALESYDFGYQFGYRMFYPGGGYPDMETDAVLYGGTDPGRFVPTYMIFCESRVAPKDRFQSPNLSPKDGFKEGRNFDRSDVYIITQNALADNTYMSYIRDQYDFGRPTNNATRLQRWLGRDQVYPREPIRIPTLDDSTRAFQQFVEDWKAGRAPPGADIQIENGRVQVTGVQAVMAINGILAKWIFDWNKEQHSFYVEESYVIAWMYPYLRPAGVIMKIEKEQLPSPQQDPKLWKDIVAKDKAYWDRLTSDFLAREEFRRNKDAQKSFSKMRSAIAGLYLWRGMLPEAEYAFRQSLQLCPDSPEGCFRLADLFMNQHRFDDAHKLMTDYLKVDPYNKNVASFINQIDALTKCEARRVELQKKMEHGAELNDVLELISVFGRMNMQSEMTSLSTNILNNTNLPPACLLQLAQLFGDARRNDLAQETYRRYVVCMPDDPQGWIELGWTQMRMNQAGDGFVSWQKAVSIGGNATRAALRTDKRLQALWPQADLPPQVKALIDSP